MDSKQVSSMPLPKLGHHSGFDVIFGFSMLHQRFAYARPSRPGEFHPEALTDPYVNLSIHTARVTARGLPPSIDRRIPPVAG